MISQLNEMEEFVYMLHSMVPEEHHFPFRDGLGPSQDQLYYIGEMPKMLMIVESTYLLLQGSFLGFMSSCLNQAKYNSHGATL